MVIRAGGVAIARHAIQRAGDGVVPIPALHDLAVRPVPVRAAKALLVREHYLHSWPGATQFAFGVFAGARMMGALAFGAGPINAHRLVDGARPGDCITLTRLWLADELPRNAESRVIGVVLRSLRKHTGLGFVVSYADPSAGHLGFVYQASGWTYTGLSEGSPLYSLNGGVPQHSRTVAQLYGTHSLSYLRDQGINVAVIQQEPKHRYVYLLDPALRDRLAVPALPYPKLEAADADA